MSVLQSPDVIVPSVTDNKVLNFIKLVHLSIQLLSCMMDRISEIALLHLIHVFHDFVDEPLPSHIYQSLFP